MITDYNEMIFLPQMLQAGFLIPWQLQIFNDFANGVLDWDTFLQDLDNLNFTVQIKNRDRCLWTVFGSFFVTGDELKRSSENFISKWKQNNSICNAARNFRVHWTPAANQVLVHLSSFQELCCCFTRLFFTKLFFP